MLSVTNKPIKLNVVMLNVVMLNVVMLNVVMLIVVMLSVVQTQSSIASAKCQSDKWFWTKRCRSLEASCSKLDRPSSFSITQLTDNVIKNLASYCNL
jgi:hypothetical protein